MKKNCLWLLPLSFVLITSCKKDFAVNSSTEPKEEKTFGSEPYVHNNRLVFSSESIFYSYIDRLFKNDKGKENFSKYQIETLLDQFNKYSSSEDIPTNLQDLQNFDFPISFQKILNKDGEVQVGDYIFWYHNGTKYYIPISEENKITQLKLNPDQIKKSTPAGSKVIPFKGKPMPEARTNFGIDGALDARHQREFWEVTPWTGNRKYVHEIVTYFDGYYPAGPSVLWHAYIYLRVKLEWRGRRWSPSSEWRDVSLNLTGDATMVGALGGYAVGPTININTSVQVNDNYVEPLGSFNGNGYTSGYWSLDLNGTIYHYVIGDDPSNAWYNTGYPLW